MDARLDYHEIRYRLESHGAFRILRKESAAFMLGFLHGQFKQRHRSDIGQAELCSELSAYAEFVRLSDGTDVRREPIAYLDEWANDGFLRKFYPADSTEACYDLTPATERALEWIGELSARGFVGTESRLLSLLDALRELAFGASFDADERRAELERQRAALDEELARLDRGETPVMDDTKILERYYGVEDAARRLLSDFKQIEQNFRDLDKDTKERIIASEGSRGHVLKEVFEHRDAIVGSDQGKSFQAFWAFLMSLDTRDELGALVRRVLTLDAVGKAQRSFPLDSLDARLVAAGARVQRMTHRLNEELRHFLDERTRSESRRVGELVQVFKRLALATRDAPPPERRFLELEDDVDTLLVMDRPLYEPELPVEISAKPLATGAATGSAAVLFDTDGVDLRELQDRIRTLVSDFGQASLSEIAKRYPVTGGSPELIGYLRVAAEREAVSDTGARSSIPARNERRRSRFVADAPDPVFLPELVP